MSEQVMLGAVAVVLGAVVGITLFVPFVAVSYRHRGTFSLRRALTWAAALVYGWAVWTYTLLPLPDPDTIQCAGTNTRPLTFVSDITETVAGAAAHPLAVLTSPVVLQVMLNVLLFVPLGFFVRVLAGRGVVVAVVAGLALSAVVELTQLTGVWGLYPCAYRVFDVDDLLVNTFGALLGSLLALLVPRHLREGSDDVAPDLPRPVTKGRRLLAMVSDLLGFTLLSATTAVVVQALLLYVLDQRETALEGRLSTVVGSLVALAVWTVVTLATGQTVGDHAVRLRYTGGPLPTAVARVARLIGGVGAYAVLGLLPGDLATLASAFAVVALVIALLTRQGRGLPGLLTGGRLEDARVQR